MTVSTTRRSALSPVRQLQVVGLGHLALFVWLGLYVSATRNLLPAGGLAETLADPAAGGLGERFVAYALAILTWGHVPLLYALTAWGLVLAGRRLLAVDDERIPLVALFWIAIALAGVARALAGWAAPVSSFLGSQYYGVSAGAMWAWFAVAALTLVRGLVGVVLGRGGKR